MATITKNENNSYKIRVSAKYLNKYVQRSMTWKPDKGMTKKAIERELQRAAFEFEDRVRNGNYFKASVKLEVFVEEWIRDYANKNMRASTVSRCKSMLIKINSVIGNFRLCDITSDHIYFFMDRIATIYGRDDIKYVTKIDLKAEIKEKGIKLPDMAKRRKYQKPQCIRQLAGEIFHTKAHTPYAKQLEGLFNSHLVQRVKMPSKLYQVNLRIIIENYFYQFSKLL